jgi:hypothetical protein
MAQRGMVHFGRNRFRIAGCIRLAENDVLPLCSVVVVVVVSLFKFLMLASLWDIGLHILLVQVCVLLVLMLVCVLLLLLVVRVRVLLMLLMLVLVLLVLVLLVLLRSLVEILVLSLLQQQCSTIARLSSSICCAILSTTALISPIEAFLALTVGDSLNLLAGGCSRHDCLVRPQCIQIDMIPLAKPSV